MKLSTNFYLKEFTDSPIAKAYDIKNEPSDKIIARLKWLCETILQPFRDKLILEKVDCQIIITSGYRCEKLNKAVGGSAKSQHMRGEACDFIIPGMTNRQIVDEVIKLDLPFHQLINEYEDLDNGGWVHVSVAPENKLPKKQVLVLGKN